LERATVAYNASRAERSGGGGARALALLAALPALACVVQTTPSAQAPASARAAAPVAGGAPFARVAGLAYGGSFCALREDGRVACWGKNFASSLGDGTNEARSRPALLAGLEGIRELRGNSPYGFCALRADASLWCWGFGYTGDATIPAAPVVPRPIARDVGAFAFPDRFPGVCVRHRDGSAACTELRASERQDCLIWADAGRTRCLGWRAGIKDTARTLAEAGYVSWTGGPSGHGKLPHCTLAGGRVSCAGDNTLGVLGVPDRPRADAAIDVPGMTDVVSLSDSGTAACAVRADGSAWCWGRNANGDLPVPPDARPCQDGRAQVACNRAPTRLSLADVAQVVLGSPLLVVTRAGALFAWRRAVAPAGTVTAALEPIAGVPPVATVVAGDMVPRVSCAITKAGEVYCEGTGADVGDGAPQVERAPVRIEGVRGAAQVEVDVTSACAALDDGTVVCWGDHVAPRGLRDIVAVAPPCALARDGRVWCWGHNDYGEMGLGFRGRPGIERNVEIVQTPLPVPGLRGVREISSSLGTICALDGAGAVRCWGRWGPRAPTLSPTVIQRLPPVDQIWVGQHGQCGLARDHQPWCWQTGASPAAVSAWGRPARLPGHGPGPESEKEICAVDGAANVSCVGPGAQPGGLDHVRQLSLAAEQASPVFRGCGVRDDGELRCWGPPICAARAALCGQSPWNEAVTVLGGVRQVSVGPFIGCAVRTDGSVWCWGQRGTGGLGERHPEPSRLVKVDVNRLVTAPADR
jgi:alpha-tubulin suppressor-like RCC1 family protein